MLQMNNRDLCGNYFVGTWHRKTYLPKLQTSSSESRTCVRTYELFRINSSSVEFAEACSISKTFTHGHLSFKASFSSQSVATHISSHAVFPRYTPKMREFSQYIYSKSSWVEIMSNAEFWFGVQPPVFKVTLAHPFTSATPLSYFSFLLST